MLVLNDNYALGGEEMNVILYQKYVTKRGKTPGKESWRAIRYYSNCENALKGLVDLKINGTGLKDLKTVVRAIEELRRMIEGLQIAKLAPADVDVNLVRVEANNG